MSWAAAEETGSRINGVGMTTSGFGSGFASCRSAFSGPSGTSRTGSGGASKLRKLTTTGGEGEIMTLSATCQPSRSEEHTSELQSLMRISYAVFCLKKKKNTKLKQ